MGRGGPQHSDQATDAARCFPACSHSLASTSLRCWQQMATCMSRGMAGSAAPRSVYCRGGCCAAAASCASCRHLLRRLDSMTPPCRRDSSEACAGQHPARQDRECAC
jgi:hypothetical protein